MTGTERIAPRKGGAPRGTAAKSEIVDIYRILHSASQPLTVPQIAEQMKGYSSAAMNAYRQHKEQTDPTWLEGKTARWGPAATREAMVWWVRQLIRSACNTKILRVATRSIINAAGITQEGTYTAGRAPMVRIQEWTETTTLVPWSPDLSERLNRGHVAGMEYIKRYDEMTCDNKKHTLADWKALAELGNRAIRSHQ